jgi:hypothetical protein
LCEELFVLNNFYTLNKSALEGSSLHHHTSLVLASSMTKFQLGYYQIFFYNILAPLSTLNTFKINHRFAHQDAVQLCGYAFDIAEK